MTKNTHEYEYKNLQKKAPLLVYDRNVSYEKWRQREHRKTAGWLWARWGTSTMRISSGKSCMRWGSEPWIQCQKTTVLSRSCAMQESCPWNTRPSRSRVPQR